MRLKLLNLSFFFFVRVMRHEKVNLKMKCTLHKDSFIGSWAKEKRDHICNLGAVYRTIDVNSISYGICWWMGQKKTDELFQY